MVSSSFIGSIELADALRVCTNTIHNWIKRGKLPRPEKIQPHYQAWPVDVIVDHLRKDGLNDAADRIMAAKSPDTRIPVTMSPCSICPWAILTITGGVRCTCPPDKTGIQGCTIITK